MTTKNRDEVLMQLFEGFASYFLFAFFYATLERHITFSLLFPFIFLPLYLYQLFRLREQQQQQQQN